jgi:hypothetical protein
MENIELKVYNQMVEWLASNRVDAEFENYGPEHASIVLTNIFKYANKRVVTLCGNLMSPVSENPFYLKSLSFFLDNPEHTLDILLDDYQQDIKRKQIWRILSNYPKRVHVRRFVKEKPSSTHFTVADEMAYREEVELEQKEAVVNFNAPDKSKRYVNMFDNWFDNSELTKEIPLP